ncbi:MAG: flavin reductase family protein [Clostridiales bacterium]|jgi:flavin reductase (DIM6/NTAB) family NADH-FMN oxidoreductase RutF|nr:flavin reductase family protein [Clostridiales bacterium]
MDFNENLAEGMTNLTTTGAFLTSKSAKGTNAMTISWGFIGVVWGKPHFITLVRPQRYTKKIIDEGNSFTVSIPWNNAMKEELAICGTKSGRDIDKGAIVKFLPSKMVEAPIVDGCQTYLECRINYADVLEGVRIPELIRSVMYDGDFHTFYFGEIVASYSASQKQA